MPARQLEEPLNIGDLFAAAIALPRQTAAEAELAAETDGDDGADIGDLHEVPAGLIRPKAAATCRSRLSPPSRWRCATPSIGSRSVSTSRQPNNSGSSWNDGSPVSRCG
jgi:hypothetical protein